MWISVGQNICLASNEQDSLKTPELKNFGSPNVNSKITLPSNVLYSGTSNDSFFTSFSSSAKSITDNEEREAINKQNALGDEGCGAFIGGLSALALSIPITSTLCAGRTDDFAILAQLYYFSMSSLILTPICASIGVSVAGDKRNQKGSFPKAFLGSIAGGALGAIVGSIPGVIQKDTNVSFFGSIIGWELGSVLGSVKGYNF